MPESLSDNKSKKVKNWTDETNEQYELMRLEASILDKIDGLEEHLHNYARELAEDYGVSIEDIDQATKFLFPIMKGELRAVLDDKSLAEIKEKILSFSKKVPDKEEKITSIANGLSKKQILEILIRKFNNGLTDNDGLTLDLINIAYNGNLRSGSHDSISSKINVTLFSTNTTEDTEKTFSHETSHLSFAQINLGKDNVRFASNLKMSLLGDKEGYQHYIDTFLRALDESAAYLSSDYGKAVSRDCLKPYQIPEPLHNIFDELSEIRELTNSKKEFISICQLIYSELLDQFNQAFRKSESFASKETFKDLAFSFYRLCKEQKKKLSGQN